MGAILPVLALLTLRRLVEVDRSTPGPTAELAGEIDSVPMLTPLSLAAKEHLAEALVPMSVAAGEKVVIRAGDRAIVFTSSRTGELEIVGARLHRTASAGDHSARSRCCKTFLERSRSERFADSRLDALERGDFLAAVTVIGRAGGRRGIAAERLARGGQARSPARRPTL